MEIEPGQKAARYERALPLHRKKAVNVVPFWKRGCMKPSLRGIMAICVGGQLSPLTEMKIQRSFTAYEK